MALGTRGAFSRRGRCIVRRREGFFLLRDRRGDARRIGSGRGGIDLWRRAQFSVFSKRDRELMGRGAQASSTVQSRNEMKGKGPRCGDWCMLWPGKELNEVARQEA